MKTVERGTVSQSVLQETAEYFELARAVFPGAGAELLAVLAGAAENGGLAYADFCALRDLIDLSGYGDSEALHVLLALLLVALEEGSLCLELSDSALRRRLRDLTGDEQAGVWTPRILDELQSRDFSEVIGRTHTDQRPIVLWHEGGRRYLYFQKYLHHDLILRADLDKRLVAAPVYGCGYTPERIGAALQAVLATPPHVDGRPLKLDAHQKRAVELGLSRNFAVI